LGDIFEFYKVQGVRMKLKRVRDHSRV